MSLQNLLEQNNYELYCDTVNVNNFGLDTIKTNNIEPLTGNNITVTGNIILPNSLSLDRQIGSSSSFFSNLWCERLQGANAPVMIQNGITGENATNPLYVATNGLQFTNTPPVAPITNYVVNFYAEYTGTMTAGNAIANTVANYRAVRMGSIVNLSFGFNQQTAAPAGNLNPIDISSLPVALRPSSTRVIAIPVIVNNTFPLGGLQINTDGTLSIYSNTKLTTYFINGTSAGIYIPDGDLYCVSYNLN